MNDPEVGLDKQVLCGAGAPPANLPGVIPSASRFSGGERDLARNLGNAAVPKTLILGGAALQRCIKSPI
jgi:hypothetical protein